MPFYAEPASAGREAAEGMRWPAALAGAALASLLLVGSAVAESIDVKGVAPCLLQNCQGPLAKCLLTPTCAADLTCILGCQATKDPGNCEIKCGDFFENETVQEFNKCALSSGKSRCVPQRGNDGSYPPPPAEAISPDFDVTSMNGAWYISAGLNELFDTFPCQIHFFVGQPPNLEDGTPGKVVAKLNWRVPEPDGEFFTRNTVQRFEQDKTRPGILYNHNNEYLHYEDDWYILDHADEADKDNGFVLVYYRGRNDAWDGYGGAVLYTRAKTYPDSIVQRVTEACKKAGLDFSKFIRTDNSCGVEKDPVLLREQFLQRQLVQTELTAAEQLTQARRYVTKNLATEVQKDEDLIAKTLLKEEKLIEQELSKDLQVGLKLEKQVEDMAKAFGKELDKDAKGFFSWFNFGAR